jgi:ferric-dicitrate binding protein FerR (iron transport regulator)
MKDRNLPRPIPPELAEEYDEHVDDAVRLARNELSPERTAAVRERMASDATYRALVEPILESYREPPLSDTEFTSRWDEFRRRLWPIDSARDDVADDTVRLRSRRKAFRRGVAIAASLVIALVGGVVAREYYETRKWEVRTAGKHEWVNLSLPDQSRVYLTPGAEVRYRRSLWKDSERRVYLKGDARFIVEHDTRAPFQVQTSTARITAVGTEFTVNATLPCITFVRVRVGTVLVQALKKDGGVETFAQQRLGPHYEARVTEKGVWTEVLSPLISPGAPR